MHFYALKVYLPYLVKRQLSRTVGLSFLLSIPENDKFENEEIVIFSKMHVLASLLIKIGSKCLSFALLETTSREHHRSIEWSTRSPIKLMIKVHGIMSFSYSRIYSLFNERELQSKYSSTF